MQINSLAQVGHDSGSVRPYRSIYICRNFYRVYPRLQYENEDSQLRLRLTVTVADDRIGRIDDCPP